jgi:hypothetical protein
MKVIGYTECDGYTKVWFENPEDANRPYVTNVYPEFQVPTNCPVGAWLSGKGFDRTSESGYHDVTHT